MTQTYHICLLPGDGIGPEIIAEGVKVLNAVGAKHGVAFSYTEALIGGCAIDATGTALPDETLRVAEASTPFCWRPSAAEVGHHRPRETASRTGLDSASARRSACTRTCVPCRSSARWPARPP